MSTKRENFSRERKGGVQSVDNVDKWTINFKSLAYNIGIYKYKILPYIYYSLSTMSTIKPSVALLAILIVRKLVRNSPQTSSKLSTL